MPIQQILTPPKLQLRFSFSIADVVDTTTVFIFMYTYIILPHLKWPDNGAIDQAKDLDLLRSAVPTHCYPVWKNI